MTEQTETTKPPGPSSKAIARYDGPRTLDDLSRYSQTIAFDTAPDGKWKANNALPVAFRGNPGAVAFATEYAKALDVSPVTALIGMHIIDGKPTASAGLISALVRRAGHRIRTWTEGSIEAGTFKAVTTIERFDDPGFVYTSEWTLARAVRAGLMKRAENGNLVASKARSGWDNYPENMCKSRTITEAARDAAEDAILGVHYTPEELGVEVDETGEPVYTVTQVPPHPDNMQAGATEAAAKAAEAMRQQSTAAPEQAAAQATDVDRDETIRLAIMRARSIDDLREVWSDPEGLNGVTDYAKAAVVGNEFDEETTIYDLFGSAVKAIEGGSRLTTRFDGPDEDGAVDAEIVPDDDGSDGSAEDGDPIPTDEPVADAPPVPPTAEQLAADLAWKTVDEAERALGSIAGELPKVARDEAVEWAAAQGLNTRATAANSAAIAKAILTGECFTDATLAALTAGDAENPVALIERVLGGVVVDEHVHTAQEQHEQKMRDNSTARVQSARDQARAAIRDAQK